MSDSRERGFPVAGPRKRSSGHVQIAIIGAGQAGLAAGRAAQEKGLTVALIEANSRIGDSWRNRYDSLRLFSPRSLSALPGLDLPGEPQGYPTKDEMADYLESYAAKFGLPVRLASRVDKLIRHDGVFKLNTPSGVVTADAVIVASGAFQVPARALFAAQLSPKVEQLDAVSYASPAQILAGPTLVVGAGATGRQIARELAATRETWLSRSGRVAITPHRLFGRDVMWWAKSMGLLHADKDTIRGKLARRNDAFPGLELTDRALKRDGIHLVGRALSASNAEVQFACGQTRSFTTVIWAAGYRDDTSWLQVGGGLDDGNIVHDRGISPVPGLYYVGKSWQTCRASALVCGVAGDARMIVERAAEFLTQRSISDPQRSRGGLN